MDVYWILIWNYLAKLQNESSTRACDASVFQWIHSSDSIVWILDMSRLCIPLSVFRPCYHLLCRLDLTPVFERTSWLLQVLDSFTMMFLSISIRWDVWRLQRLRTMTGQSVLHSTSHPEHSWRLWPLLINWFSQMTRCDTSQKGTHVASVYFGSFLKIAFKLVVKSCLRMHHSLLGRLFKQSADIFWQRTCLWF